MVLLSLAQFGEASVFVNPRRRGGINYAADSAEAKWAAEAAAQPCREDTRGRISVDQEAGAFEMRPRGTRIGAYSSMNMHGQHEHFNMASTLTLLREGQGKEVFDRTVSVKPVPS